MTAANAAERTLVGALAEFAASVSYDTLPPAVRESVKQRSVDIFGICARASLLPEAGAAHALATRAGGVGEASAVGAPTRMPVTAAAFVNGTLAHSLDFDDTHLPSVLHPSATVIPTAFAVAEACGVGGRELMAAAAAGYEVIVRTGMAAYDRELGNSTFFEKGFHATSICGTLGAAVVAAKLLGLDVDGIANALAIATSLGSGVIEANRSGGSVKRIHCGWAAQAGITAAFAALHGITGPRTALEGRFGFYNAFCDRRFNPAEILEGLGESWSVPDIFFKPYPTNHFTHGGIDAAIALRARVDVSAIVDIELGVAAPTLRTIAQPEDVKARPATGYAAQFSGPFTVAVALVGGRGLGVALDDFSDERVRDPLLLDLAGKVRCVPEPRCDSIFPNQFPAVLRIATKDGSRFEHWVLENRGGPGNPLTQEEIRQKFMSNVQDLMPSAEAESLVRGLGHLEEAQSIADTVASTRLVGRQGSERRTVLR